MTGPLTLATIASHLGGEVTGDAALEVRGVAPLEDAAPDQLGLLASRKYLGRVPESRAGALLVSRSLVESVPDGRSRIVVEDAHRALVGLLGLLHPPESVTPGVHPTAVLGTDVVLHPDVEVGAYTVLGDGVVVGAGSRIGAHCVIGRASRIGAGTILHPHVVLYPETEIGDETILHAGARIGVDGFGYVFDQGEHRKVPQVGRCRIGDRVEIGANCCVDRGSIGETRVGNGTKMDNLVHLAHNVHVGQHVLLVAQVGIAGSTRIGDGVVLGGQSGVSNHLEVGAGARIAAKTGVIGDVAAGETVMGFPARPHREFLRAQAAVSRLGRLMPRLRKLLRGTDVEA